MSKIKLMCRALKTLTTKRKFMRFIGIALESLVCNMLPASMVSCGFSAFIRRHTWEFEHSTHVQVNKLIVLLKAMQNKKDCQKQ